MVDETRSARVDETRMVAGRRREKGEKKAYDNEGLGVARMAGASRLGGTPAPRGNRRRLCLRRAAAVRALSFPLISMSVPAIGRQLRTILTQPADAFALSELLAAVDDFVATSYPEIIAELEEELQTINAEEVDHTVLYQIQVLLAVLSHLEPVLSADIIISSWFDILLRPALREAKLSTTSVDQAKELVLSALRKADDVSYDKVCSFRRRLLDLYLGATFNEAGDDVLEWAELDEREKEKWACWKSNLEDVLLKHGTQCPAVRTSCLLAMYTVIIFCNAGIYGRSKRAFRPAGTQAAAHRAA